MTWVFIGLVVVVVAAVAAVAVGHGEGLAVAPPDRPEVAVPAGRPLTAADLAGVGLTVGLRGYRMDEVDDLLARLGTELTERDRRLAASSPAAVGDPDSPPADAMRGTSLADGRPGVRESGSSAAGTAPDTTSDRSPDMQTPDARDSHSASTPDAATPADARVPDDATWSR